MIIASAVLAALAAGSQAPRWIDILPLPDPIPESYVADAAFLGDETISDGIAWSCKLVPEGDPAVDKASVYAERFRRVAPRVRARSKIRQGFLIQATIGHGWTPGRATPWQKIVQAAFPEWEVGLISLPLSICCHTGEGALGVACVLEH